MQLFNQLLLRRECCSFSNGEYVKTGLAEVELWIGRYKDWVGESWEQLAHIRQVRWACWAGAAGGHAWVGGRAYSLVALNGRLSAPCNRQC